VGRTWAQIGAECAGLKIVYNKPFALDTIDFAPIVSAMLATKPDLLSWNAAYAQFNEALTEQAYLQGWKGPINVNFCEVPVMLSKVPKEWLEKRIIVSSPEWSDPGMGEKANKVYAEAARRWEYVPSAISIPYDTGIIWEQGVKLAGTFDSTAVRNALLNADELQGTLTTHSSKFYAKWSNQIYGISNYILPKKGPVMIVKGERLTTAGWFDYVSWYTEHGEFFVKRLKEEGLLWSQIKK
jgi:branched-chain amino acid transport system substrate-binding protein